MSDQPTEVPRAEQARYAREHYEALAREACDWNSLIPEALAAWEREPILLARVEAGVRPAGWECPRCHRVNAPHHLVCVCQPLTPVCFICGQGDVLMQRVGYGSGHDGEPICHRCLGRAIDAAACADTFTLLGWADARLMPPQFDECKAVVDELEQAHYKLAAAERRAAELAACAKEAILYFDHIGNNCAPTYGCSCGLAKLIDRIDAALAAAQPAADAGEGE